MVSGFTLAKLGSHAVPPYWFIVWEETGYEFVTSSDSKIFQFLSHSGEQIKKISGFAVEFAGCVWTEAVSGKKKLRIQKFPVTCERGLS